MAYADNVIEEQSAFEDRYLTFPLADELVGIDLEYVKEIIGVQAITPVPGVPDYLEGVINLRGKPIPIINVRKKFGYENIEFDFKTSVIVLEYTGMTIGLLVDSVEDVVHIPSEEITDYDNKSKQANGQYLKAITKVEDKVVMVIDCEKLLAA